MAITNLFRARLTAWHTYLSSENAIVHLKKPKVSRKEIQRFVGKLR